MRMKDNNSVPAGWKWVECQEVIDVRDGTHDTPKYVSNGFPLITSKHLSSSGINLDEVQFISEEDHRNISKRSRVDKGDILYAMIGTIGNPVIVETETDFSIKNIALFKFHQGFVYNKFFKHMLDADIIKRQILSNARGGIQKFASLKVLRGLKIPLPPLAEQKRIAAILDKADSICRKRRQAIQLADEFLRSVFLDMFGDPATNPKNWPRCTIRDVVAEVKYGTSKKASNSVGNYPILRMNNITYEGNLDLTDLKYINFNKKEEHKYLAQKDDILFNRTNSRDLVGKTAVYDRVQSMAIAGYLIRVRTNIKSNPYYISAYLNSKHGKKTLKNMCKNIIGMANINAQELQDIEILLPPIDLQNKFAEITTKVRDKKKTLISAKKRANTLFKALCQGSFRGEI